MVAIKGEKFNQSEEYSSNCQMDESLFVATDALSCNPKNRSTLKCCPLFHLPIALLEEISKRQAEKRRKCEKDSKSEGKESEYLCTNCSIYLEQEPCVMYLPLFLFLSIIICLLHFRSFYFLKKYFLL